MGNEGGMEFSGLDLFCWFCGARLLSMDEIAYFETETIWNRMLNQKMQIQHPICVHCKEEQDEAERKWAESEEAALEAYLEKLMKEANDGGGTKE